MYLHLLYIVRWIPYGIYCMQIFRITLWSINQKLKQCIVPLVSSPGGFHNIILSSFQVYSAEILNTLANPPHKKKMKATSWYEQYACFLHYESLDYVILHYVRSCRDVFVGFSIQEGNFISHSLQTSVIETFLAHNGLFSGSFTTFLSLSLTQFYPAVPGWCSNKYCTVDLRSVY